MSLNNNSHISEKAKIGSNVKIGPFCYIGDNVEIADDVEIKSHVVIDCKAKIGKGTSIFPFVSINDQQTPQTSGDASCVEIGENNVIREYCTIQAGTEAGGSKTVIGNNNLLMVGTHIAHDCQIGNNVIMANLATLGGHVIIEDHVVIGGLAAVHQFVRIGAHAMIGGVCGVVRDVVPYATVLNDRASVEGVNLVGLRRRGFDKNDIMTLQKAFKEIFFENHGDLKGAVADAQKKYPDSELVSTLVDFMGKESRRSYTTAFTAKKKGEQ